MPSQAEIQEQITSRILEGLKNGTVPWRKPWRDDPNCGPPSNVVTYRPYSGINPIILDLTAMSRGYSSRWWGTFKQWEKLGARIRKRPDHVKPGQWGTNVVFYRQIEKTTVENGEETVETFPLMRSFTVFNLDQVDGEGVDHLRTGKETTGHGPNFEQAEAVISATQADIRYAGNRAFYARPLGTWPDHHDGDFIQVPERAQFKSVHEFYGTMFHELCHWGEVRLGWSGTYAFGELVAEIGSCNLCAQINVPSSNDLANHTAYLSEWLKQLENDRKFIFKAAAQASKAASLILSFSRKAEEALVMQ